MENISIAPNEGRDNKIVPVTLDRVPSDYAIMALAVNPDQASAGFVAHYLIKREDVAAWQELYGQLSYVEVPFDDYSEFLPWTRNS